MDHTKKLEDASGSLRRWMATCMAAARGEFPRTGGRPRAKVEPPKVETLLLPARVGVLGERHRTRLHARDSRAVHAPLANREVASGGELQRRSLECRGIDH
eukprot:g26821.t1